MRSLLVVFIGCFLFPSFLNANPGVRKQSPAKPLSFIENKGQITDQHQEVRNDIDFKLDAGDIKIFVGDGTLHYQWQKVLGTQLHDDPKTEIQTEVYRLDVVLEGANINAEAIKDEQQAYYENYYQAQVSGVTAHSFNKITYKNIYPEIDWVLYSNNGQLKYDFIVHPGGDPSNIKLRYEGATSLSLKNGAVTAITPFGSITEKKPYSYIAGTTPEVPSSFVLKNNVLSFDVGPMDAILVIDPVLEWGTYFGGNNGENANSISTDSLANVYIAGGTTSSNIATAGVHDVVLSGFQDAFIAKLDKNSQPVWCTYYGGSANDFIWNITGVVDGRLYVTGGTQSPDGIASAGAHDEVYGSLTSAYILFAACFTEAGQRAWGTYYPTTYIEEARIACDKAGNAYLLGSTYEAADIATPGTFMPNQAAGLDLFLVKFDKDGVRLWGSYYGTAGNESMGDVAVDADGNIIFCGDTQSPNLLTTPGSHQPSNAGMSDAFLVRFGPDGLMTHTTYYGGNGNDYAIVIECKEDGAVYLAGTTASTTGIATAGAHQAAPGSNSDGFLVKFNKALVRQWGTYYGGDMADFPHGIAADNEQNVYLAGRTESTNNIASANGHQLVQAGASDGFLAKFDEAGKRIWGSYYGGVNYDNCLGAATDPLNNILVCGTTQSPTGISNPAGSQIVLKGPSDGFVAQFYDTTVFINQPFNDTLLCVPQQFSLPYTVQYIFHSMNEFRAQLSDANGSFANPVNVGYLKANQSAAIPVTIPLNTPPGNGYRIRIVSSMPYYVSKDNGVDIRVTDAVKVAIAGPTVVCANDSLKLVITDTVAGATYQWLTPQGMTHTGPMIYAAKASALGSGNYIITANRNGCIGKDTVVVTVKPAPVATEITNNSPICAGKQLKLTAVGNIPSSYTWYGPDGLVVNGDIMLINGTTAKHRDWYKLLLNSNGCASDTISVFADVVDLQAWIDAVPLLYQGDSLILTGNSNRIDSVTYSWTGPAGFSSGDKIAMMADIAAAQRGSYTFTVSRGACSASASIYVRVSEELVFTISPNPNKGLFTISGNTQENQEVNFEIVDAMGKAIYRDSTTTKQKRFSKSIEIAGRLSNGVYVLRLDVKGKKRDVRFVVSD